MCQKLSMGISEVSMYWNLQFSETWGSWVQMDFGFWIRSSNPYFGSSDMCFLVGLGVLYVLDLTVRIHRIEKSDQRIGSFDQCRICPIDSIQSWGINTPCPPCGDMAGQTLCRCESLLWWCQQELERCQNFVFYLGLRGVRTLCSTFECSHFSLSSLLCDFQGLCVLESRETGERCGVLVAHGWRIFCVC